MGTPLSGGEAEHYLAQRQAKRKRSRRTYAIVLAVAIAALSVYVYRSRQVERRKQAAAAFLDTFQKLDDGPIAEFWRCATRKPGADIHRAQDNLVVTNAVQQAYRRYGERQALHLQRECLPMLQGNLAEIDALKPPKHFAEPLEQLKKTLQQLDTVFQAYVAKLEQGKDLATREQRVIEAAKTFHNSSARGVSDAIGYVELLRCAVPGLSKMARSVRRPPNTQDVVEYIYSSCKTDPAYADRLREKCFGRLERSRRTKFFRLVSRRMAGDDRDIAAITHCFSTANRSLFRKELSDVGRGWVDYRNAVKQVLNRVTAYKG